MKTPFVLAIDIGTSSTRSAVYDATGDRLPATTAQVEYPLITGPDGRAELRPADIDGAVRQVLTGTLKAWRKQEAKDPLAGIGVSCFWHSLLGVDAKGRPLTPIYTWGDSRCRHDAESLRRSPGEVALHARTGCMARASFWPAKLLWLRRTQPRLFRRVARWVSAAEWIQELWCGRATVSISMASGTGLLNGRTLRWDAPLLKRCGLDESRLHSISGEPATISPSMARCFPGLAGVAWHPALGDGAASNLGSGATCPGCAAINVGTSAALRVVVKGRTGGRGPLAPFGLFAYRVDDRRGLLGGAVSNAGNLHAWARRELQLPGKPAELEALMRARSGPVPGLMILPFWMAERAPTWPEDLPSAVIGITQGTSALDLLQSLQEATYLRLAQIAAMVEKASGRRLSFIVSGGIRHSPEALQRLANCLGRPVYASSEPEASLRGAACFVLEQLGLRSATPKMGRALRPQPGAVRAYTQARERQGRLEKLLREVVRVSSPSQS